MSMVLYLRRADSSDLEALKNGGGDQQQVDQPPAKQGLFARLFGKSASAQDDPIESVDPIRRFFFASPPEGDLIDFDRAWDALNMMLTGVAFESEGPLAIFYHQGEEIGPDHGYGPARHIPAEKMKEFADALQYLRDDDLASRFDPTGFEDAQLYASYLFSEDGIEVDYIMQWVPSLRQFADKCVETNSGALVAIH